MATAFSGHLEIGIASGPLIEFMTPDGSNVAVTLSSSGQIVSASLLSTASGGTPSLTFNGTSLEATISLAITGGAPDQVTSLSYSVTPQSQQGSSGPTVSGTVASWP